MTEKGRPAAHDGGREYRCHDISKRSLNYVISARRFPAFTGHIANRLILADCQGPSLPEIVTSGRGGFGTLLRELYRPGRRRRILIKPAAKGYL